MRDCSPFCVDLSLTLKDDLFFFSLVSNTAALFCKCVTPVPFTYCDSDSLGLLRSSSCVDLLT